MKMKRILWAFLFVFLNATSARVAEQPPNEIKDPAINENFKEIYRLLSTHNHSDSDSVPLWRVLPSSPPAFNQIGYSTSPWAAVQQGEVVISSPTYDLWIPTGTDKASWKIVKSVNP